MFLQIPPKKRRETTLRETTRERDKADDSFFKKGSSDPRFLSLTVVSLSLYARAPTRAAERERERERAEREREKTGVLILFNSCFASFFSETLNHQRDDSFFFLENKKKKIFTRHHKHTHFAFEKVLHAYTYADE